MAISKLIRVTQIFNWCELVTSPATPMKTEERHPSGKEARAEPSGAWCHDDAVGLDSGGQALPFTAGFVLRLVGPVCPQERRGEMEGQKRSGKR